MKYMDISEGGCCEKLDIMSYNMDIEPDDIDVSDTVTVICEIA